MKKILIICCALVVGVSCAFAEKPLSADKLPQQARDFISRHFSGNRIRSVEVDGEVLGAIYDVTLEDGTEIEFLKNGDWREIKCPKGAEVPESAVPKKICEMVSRRYAGASIRSIEHTRRDCEVKLSNGMELTFDRNYNLVGYDD